MFSTRSSLLIVAIWRKHVASDSWRSISTMNGVAAGFPATACTWLTSLTLSIPKDENPSMTRKDYVAIATAMHHAYRTCENPHIKTWEAVVLRLSETFKADNPRFDSERFINACYGIP